MAGRSLVLWLSLALIALFAFLTFYVMVQEGVAWIVGLSLVSLLMLGIGVVGALTQPPDE